MGKLKDALAEAEAYLLVRQRERWLSEAAPELLEALKGVVRVADRKTVEFDRARAAIAKAEGRNVAG